MNKENQQLVYFEPDKENEFPFTSRVECYLGGVGQLVFGDGTFQFAENKTFPEIVYSPRLTEIEMELFCKNNISFYETYFNENRDAIDLGNDLPPIARFWEHSESLTPSHLVCKTCGETMSGDGYSVVFHCPNADTSLGYEPDANPVFCTESSGDEDNHE